MNNYWKSRRPLDCALVMAAGCLGMVAPSAEAALSTYSGSATLTYTINSITNTTNPGNLGDLVVTGFFEQQGGPASHVITSGDGAVNAANAAFPSAPVTSPWSHSFTTSGSVTDGVVDASHLGWFSLDFANQGTDLFNISVTLTYQLDANAAGESAASLVHLDYFNTSASFSGSADAVASSIAQNVASTPGTSAVFNFSLAALGTESLLSDVTITGNLQASAVPLPAAVWLFGAGLAPLFRLRTRKSAA